MQNRLIRAAGLALLCACIAPAAYAGDDNDLPIHSGPLLEASYSLGGSDLIVPQVAGKYTSGATMFAGSAFTLGVGWMELGGHTRIGLKQEISYSENNNCDNPFEAVNYTAECQVYSTYSYDFSHVNYEAQLLIGIGPEDSPWQASLGAGILYVRHPLFTVHDVNYQDLQDIAFDNAHGWTVQIQYARVGLRYTHIRYQVQGSGAEVDGSNLGIYLMVQF